MSLKIGMCFSRQLEGNDPLGHIGVKLPVYLRLLELCQKKGWEAFVLTRRTYLGSGIFAGYWRFEKGKFLLEKKKVKIDLVYDRTGGLKFPLEGDLKLRVVNRRDFKLLCWNKWLAFSKIGQFMPKTFWVGEKENLPAVLKKIKTDWVVLKPYNGLKGIGVFVGPKSKVMDFEFLEKYPKYIAQEFIDTSGGIPGVVEGLHDLRIVIVNKKAVWSHVRTPPLGSFTANVAQGGEIKEVDYRNQATDAVKTVVEEIAERFYQEFDSPSYSLDFGVEDGKAKIFEVNDQVGFPTWEMKARDAFLKGLIGNFETKLKENRTKHL